jgi:putative sigma-54 modulation protein
MQTQILCRGFKLTQAIRRHTEKRLMSAISFAEHHIGHITVRLSDINGPRGGEDKRCQLVLKMKGMPSVVIEDIETNLYAAIDHASERAGQVISRLIHRRHNYRSLLSPS